MAQIFPFRAYRYTSKVGDVSQLVTQPYDKIPDDVRESYLAQSRYNFVRLEKGKGEPGDGAENNVYTRAGTLFNEWIAEGVVAQDSQPSFYPYFQEFDHPETGERIVRKGFIGTLEIEEYEKQVVHGHELTHRGPKEDRLKLTAATRAHFGQLLLLYDDPQRRVDAILDEAAAEEPLMRAEEQGVAHRLWRIVEPLKVKAIQDLLADKKLMIADGHHRYETALAYSQQNPDVAGASRVMLTLVNMSSPGLVVLATHRVLTGLQSFSAEGLLARIAERFTVEKCASADDLREKLEGASKYQSAIGSVLQGDEAAYLLRVRPGSLDGLLEGTSEAERRLDVVILHRALIGATLGMSEEDVRELRGIDYIRGFANAVKRVRGGQAQAAFLLRPVEVDHVAEISFSGGVMPQKSTDFYPKLLSGFAIYRFG